MSLPLHDCGKVYVSERAHSYLRAKSTAKRVDLVTFIRELVEAYVDEELHVHSVANDIHNAKGLGRIDGDSQ